MRERTSSTVTDIGGGRQTRPQADRAACVRALGRKTVRSALYARARTRRCSDETGDSARGCPDDRDRGQDSAGVYATSVEAVEDSYFQFGASCAGGQAA